MPTSRSTSLSPASRSALRSLAEFPHTIWLRSRRAHAGRPVFGTAQRPQTPKNRISKPIRTGRPDWLVTREYPRTQAKILENATGRGPCSRHFGDVRGTRDRVGTTADTPAVPNAVPGRWGRSSRSEGLVDRDYRRTCALRAQQGTKRAADAERRRRYSPVCSRKRRSQSWRAAGDTSISSRRSAIRWGRSRRNRIGRPARTFRPGRLVQIARMVA